MGAENTCSDKKGGSVLAISSLAMQPPTFTIGFPDAQKRGPEDRKLESPTAQVELHSYYLKSKPK